MTLTRSRLSSVYRHEQSEASDTWTINHGLESYPMVDVYITIDSQLRRIIPSNVIYVNPNTCQVQFLIPVSGFATVA